MDIGAIGMSYVFVKDVKQKKGYMEVERLLHSLSEQSLLY